MKESAEEWASFSEFSLTFLAIFSKSALSYVLGNHGYSHIQSNLKIIVMHMHEAIKSLHMWCWLGAVGEGTGEWRGLQIAK